jgi:N,N'-diacetylchitobiose transport system permease protein
VPDRAPPRPGRRAAPPGARRRPWAPRLLPYAMITPASVVLAAVLGYPVVRLVLLSFQRWGLAQIFNPDAGPRFVGLDNYARILGDRFFWTVLLRSAVLTAAMVSGSMLAGVAVAFLMRAVPGWCRWLMTFALVTAWAVPHVVSTEIFAWMTDYSYGVLNWLLGIPRHNWYIDSRQGLAVATAVVIWGAVPLIAVSTYAALTQVPGELVDAARVDGARADQVLRRVTLPAVRPVLVVLTALSVIWDFQVFTQIWVLRQANPTSDYFTLGIYAYAKAYGSHQYGYASALAVVIVVLLVGVLARYLRALSEASR